MTTISHSEIHGDHRYWQSEIKMWRDDIQQWQQEREDCIAELLEAINRHDRAMECHTNSIVDHQSAIVDHEHFIAECEQNSSAKDKGDEATFAETHQGESSIQNDLRASHERIKKRHHTVMAKLAMVVASLKHGL